jgi:hypothetical protein
MCPFHLTAHTLTIDGPFGRVELVSTAPLAAPATGPAPGPDEPSTDD